MRRLGLDCRPEICPALQDVIGLQAEAARAVVNRVGVLRVSGEASEAGAGGASAAAAAAGAAAERGRGAASVGAAGHGPQHRSCFQLPVRRPRPAIAALTLLAPGPGLHRGLKLTAKGRPG